MHPIDSSRLYMTSYRKPAGLGSFAIGLMLMLICLLVPSDVSANGCLGPRDWTDSTNPFAADSDRPKGAYIAKLHKIIDIGADRLKSDDFYITGSVDGKKMKWKMNGYLALELYVIEIVEKFSGDIDVGTKLFMLLTRFSAERDRKSIIDAVGYEFDPSKMKPVYIAFAEEKIAKFRNINQKTGIISDSKTFLGRKFIKIINKYTNRFIWSDNCSTWRVDDIYNGVDYPVVRFIEKFIAPRNSAESRP